jgi:predicted RNA binding protein YcfA (HicA-like mRNA interferase family)
MPRKIRELIADLEKVGWIQTDGGKGSSRILEHPRSMRKIILIGQPGADAHHSLEKLVDAAIREVQK